MNKKLLFKGRFEEILCLKSAVLACGYGFSSVKGSGYGLGQGYGPGYGSGRGCDLDFTTDRVFNFKEKFNSSFLKAGAEVHSE